MPAPLYSSGLIHVAQPLMDLCAAYDPSSDNYIRSVFFPRKQVAHMTDLIWQIDKASMLRLYDLEMGPNSLAPSVSFRTNGTISYSCKTFGARASVNQLDVANADASIQFEQRATKQALTSVGIRMEKLALATLRDTAIVTNYDTLGASEYWDNFNSSASDPVGVLSAAVSLVRVKTGKANGAVKVAMHQFVWDRIKLHPNVVSRMIFTGGAGAMVTPEIFANLIGLKSAADLVITSAYYTSSAEGAGTTTYSSFIGPDVLVGFVEDGGLDDQALGHEFAFNGLVGDDPFLVRKYRKEEEGMLGADYVQVGVAVDYKVTNVDAAFLIQNAVDASNTGLYGTFLQ